MKANWLSVPLLLLLLPGFVWADNCSSLIGQVVFNEINHHTQSCDYSYSQDVFVELRSLNNADIVDNVGLDSHFSNFTMTVCAAYPQLETDSGKPRCYSGNPAVGYGTGTNGATGTDSQIEYNPELNFANAENSGNPWIVLYGSGKDDDKQVIPQCYLDINADSGNTSHGMELVVYDKDGKIIDYQLTDDLNDFGHGSDGYVGDGGCSFVYDNYFDGANGFNVQRMPDGTGCWPDENQDTDTCIGTPEAPPPGNSGEETTNTTNDTLPDGTTDVPMISIDNIEVTPGGDATFTVSIIGYYNLADETVNNNRTTNEASSPIQITYDTYDSSAVAPGDYTAIPSDIGTYISIPSGASTATITVSTNSSAGVGEQFFARLTSVLSSSTAPAMIDTFYGVATFIQGVDHYSISHSGSGVTCEGEAITITAHNSSHDAAAPSSTTTITLATTSTNSGTESWSLKSGNGSFNGTNQYTFDGTEASVEFWYLQSTEEANIDIDVTDGSATDNDGDATEDPTISFSDAGFRFYNDDGSTVTQGINTQIGGKPSSTSPGNGLILRAVEKDTDTGACKTAITGSQIVKMAYQCIDPNTCSANELLIDANATYVAASASTISGNSATASPLSYTDVTLTFDTNGEADFSLLYNNVGKLNLHAQATLAAGSGDTSSPSTSANTLSGSSGNFIVRPFGYYLEVRDNASPTPNTNPGATGPTGSAFVSAGTDFTVITIAKLWDSNDDTVGTPDGIPDGRNDYDPTNNTADLSDNATATAYGTESTGTEIVLTSDLVDPSGNDPGLLDSNTSVSPFVSSFTSGSGSNSNVYFNEVGVIEILAENTTYLGEAITVYGSSGYVGRFSAASFNVSLSASDFAPENGTFTYLGQTFNYGTSPNLTITAVSALGTPLNNYTGDYWKLTSPLSQTSGVCGTDEGFCYSANATDWSAATTYSEGDVIRNSIDGYLYVVTTAGTSGAAAPTWDQTTTDGTVVYERISVTSPAADITFDSSTAAAGSITISSIHSGEDFLYSRPDNPVPPFDADLQLQFVIQDSDGASGSASLDNTGFSGDSLGTDAHYSITNDSFLRYGRATLTDAYGASDATLSMTFNTEYYSGSTDQWIINTDDLTSALTALTDTTCSSTDFSCSVNPADSANLLVSGTSITPGNSLTLTPSTSLNGEATVSLTTPDWLKFDWNGDGTQEFSNATATFGIFRSDDRFYYWREER